MRSHLVVGGLTVASLTILGLSGGWCIAVVESAASLVTWAAMVVGSTSCGQLGISGVVSILVLALPELAASTCTCALGVVVGWRWAISLLLLVVLD